jgi:hypothetical protein
MRKHCKKTHELP